MPVSSTVDVLRARIESIERGMPDGALRPSALAQHRRRATPADEGSWARAFSFGLGALDDSFSSGGLSFGAHEICGPAGEPAAALLFTVLMLARLFRDDASAQALVVQEPGALNEGGGLYGPGLWALGVDPGRLVLVSAREGGDALRIVDEAVRSGAVCAVVAEAPRARRLDLAATQRLNLYGRQTATLALLVVPDLDATSASMTRWRVRSRPSRAPRAYLGPPALELDLVRNRLGPPGRFTVEWSSDDETFRLPAAPAASLPASVVSPSADRPAAAAGGPRLAAGGG